MSNRSHAASAPMAAAAALLALGALFGLRPKAGAASPRPQVQAGLRVALAAGEQRVIISVAEAGERLDEAAIAQRQGRLLSVLGAGFRLDQRYRNIGAVAGQLGPEGLDRLTAAGLPKLAVAADPALHAYLDASVPFVGADKLRRQGITGKGVVVVVMDTGVDVDHVDLKDAIVDQICTLVPKDRCGPAGKAADDKDGHGTHVAGIIASRGKKASYGMAPGAGIIAMKFLETRNTGAGSDMVAALDLLLKRDDVDVINMSLGTNSLYEASCDTADAYTKALAQAFGKLKAAGVISVAASGNDGSPNKMGAPACVDDVVSVGAVEIGADAKLASFTNRGVTLDLLAPGVGIDATLPGNDVGSKQGTSMASPHVAGAFALLLQAAPWAGQDLLETLLKQNGQRPTISVGGNSVSTIKVDRALTALKAITPTATEEAPPTATLTPVPPSATPSGTPTEAPRPTASFTPQPEPDTPTPAPTREPSLTPTSRPLTPVPAEAVFLPLLRRGE